MNPEPAGFGPAQGTKARPYRCICCRVAYDDIERICWACMSGKLDCRSCRERGIWVSDFRVGRWNHNITEYDPEGGLGHRLVSLSRTNGIMACGVRIPKPYFGDGSAVIPECPVCWGVGTTDGRAA